MREKNHSTQSSRRSQSRQRRADKRENGRMNAHNSNLRLRTEIRSFVIALLAGGKRNGKPVARRRKRAGGVRSVGTRGIFQTIKIEHELARFIEAVDGEGGIEEAAGTIGGGRTGCVAKNEEKFCDRGIFEDRLKPKRSSRKSEFRGARNGLIVAGADKRGECDGFVRGIGNPFCGDAINGVRRVPLEFVETDDGGRMRILDAKSEARLAADHVHVEGADREMRRNFIVVGFSSQRLRFCGSPSDEKVRTESSRGRIQRDGFAFEVKDGEMRWSTGKMDFVAGSRSDGIISRLEPFKAGERQPAVRLEKVRPVFCAPGSGVFLPGSLLRRCGRG